jgi:hypothetical protein
MQSDNANDLSSDNENEDSASDSDSAYDFSGD